MSDCQTDLNKTVLFMIVDKYIPVIDNIAHTFLLSYLRNL